jgi:hypothetical protein
MTWHVFSSHPKTEYATAQAIRDLGLGLTAYVPTEIVERTRGHKATVIRQPALRGYVFVECDGARDDLSKISALEGFCSWIWATLPDGTRKPATVPSSGLAEVFMAELFGEFDMRPNKGGVWRPKAGERGKVSKWGRAFIGHLLVVGIYETSMRLPSGRKVKVRTEELEAA